MKHNIRTIAAQLPFADTLAGWALDKWGGDPLALPRALILVPSRRAAQSLREAFLRAGSGRPLLLPRIEPLGDADEDAVLLSPSSSLTLAGADVPELFTFRRLFLLARLVQRQRAAISGRERMDHALYLAQGLAELMDECEREEVSLDGIRTLAPDALAAHWQVTVEFLQILSEHWPGIARTQGLASPGAHQGQVLHALAAHWRQSQPVFPVIAAGLTGSIPSIADALSAITGLAQGYIVLPGLDTDADEAYFDAMEETHPQWGMAQLLKKLGCAREDVSSIGQAQNDRVRLLSEVMRPASTSERWRDAAHATPDALAGLDFIDCAHLQEEATVIACMLRETLERPGETAALVTPNRGLARRVVAIMQRFGVMIDDSAGLPLKETPLVAFLRLIQNAAAEGMRPLALIGLLKHPLARAGMERIVCLEAAREIELLALRGLAREGGLESIRQTLLMRAAASPEAYLLLDSLEAAFAPLLALLAGKEALLSECLEAHMACAEALGPEDIWNGREGEVFSQFLAELRAASKIDGLVIETESYAGMFEQLLFGRVLRPHYGMHPRLKVLGPIEARMQSFDRIILGGLNEGGWPAAAGSDPWFSRPMRAALGLPAPERRLGLAAHDFFTLASAPEVMLTRSAKEEGQPMTPSRWLVKLKMLAGDLTQPSRWLAWARALDAPDAVRAMEPPAPRPPLAARPRDLSVTEVETWMRDPYALYASQILRLRALEPLGRAPNGADFGNAAHKALERFVRLYPEALPADALARLMALGREAFAGLFEATNMEVLWWPRFARIAEWIVAQEEARRPLLAVAAEVEASCRVGDFRLRGRADRVERTTDGGLTIVDYKTGGLPPVRDIEGGLSSQLVLLALMAREGGMGLKGEPIRLEYWQLSGGADAGSIKPIKEEKIEELMEDARRGLNELIARFDNPDFPYRSTPIPSRASRYSDYEHLARAKEWGVI